MKDMIFSDENKHYMCVYGSTDYGDIDFIKDTIDMELFGFTYRLGIPKEDTVFIMRKSLDNNSVSDIEKAIIDYSRDNETKHYTFKADDPDFFKFLDGYCGTAVLFIKDSDDLVAQSLLNVLQENDIPYTVYNNEKSE